MIFRRRPLSPEHYLYVRQLSESLARGDVHVADEIAQDTMVVAVSADRTEVRSTRAWLTGIARNVSLGRHRRVASGPRFVELKGAVESGEHLSDPAEAATEAELREGLAGLMKTLPAPFAEVIRLRVFDDLPPRKIAAILDLPIETVRSRLRRGLALLKSAVERDLSEHVDHRMRGGFGLSMFGRWPWALGGGILASLAIVAAILWNSPGAQVEQESALVGLAAQDPELMDPLGSVANATREVASVEAVLAPTVDLRLSPKAQEGQPSELAIQLLGPNDVVHEVTLTGQGIGAQLADLAPGLWSARIGSTLLGSREFAPGKHVWELELPQRNGFIVHVHNEDGLPVAGVRVFSQDGTWGLAQEVAITDAHGDARLTLGGASQWLAGMKEGGLRTESLYVDQVSLGGRVKLKLFSHAVHPHRFLLPADVASRVSQVRAVPLNQNHRFRVAPQTGVTGPAHWIPIERDPQGRHLVIGSQSMVVEFLDASGAVLALVRRKPLGEPEEVEVGGRAPRTVSGCLLGLDSRPVRGATLHLVPAKFSGRAYGRVQTDESGRFQFKGVPSLEWRIVQDGSVLASFGDGSPADEIGGIQALGDLVVKQYSLRGSVVGDFAGKRLHALRGLNPQRSIPALFGGAPIDLEPVTVSKDGVFYLEGKHPSGVRALIVTESGLNGADDLTAVIQCPTDGWTAESLTISVDECFAIPIQCRLAESLLPARVGAFHRNGSLSWPIEVDNVTGELTGLKLCSGDWGLAVLAGDGTLHRLEIQCPDGLRDTLELGCFEGAQGTVRVFPPDGVSLLNGVDVVALQLTRGSLSPEELRVPVSTMMDQGATMQLSPGPLDIEVRRGGKSFHASAVVEAGQSIEVSLRRRQPMAQITLSDRVDPMDTLDLELLDQDGLTVEIIEIKHAIAERGRRFEVPIPRLESGTIKVTSRLGKLAWSIPIRSYRDLQRINYIRHRREARLAAGK